MPDAEPVTMADLPDKLMLNLSKVIV